MKRNYNLSATLALIWFLTSFVAAQQKGVPSPDAQKTEGTRAASRAKELMALAESGKPGAGETLRQSLKDDNWYVRGAAVRAIAALGDGSSTDAMLTLVRDPNWYVRDAALSALGVLKIAPDESGLAELLASKDAYTRARAVRALGMANSATPGDTLIARLLPFLKDDDEFVKRCAVIALGNLKAEKAADSLVAFLKDDDPGLRKAAAMALGRIGYKAAAGAIATVSKSSDDWEYADALYRIGDRDALDAVIAALRSRYADERISVLRDLLEFADSRAVPALVDLASPQQSTAVSAKLSANESFLFRVMIAEGLGRFSGTEAKAALVKMIEDPAPRVRSAAAASLVKVSKANPRDDATISVLVAALERERLPPVQTTIIEALASFDRARVADLLLQTKAPDRKLAEAVTRALSAVDVTADSLVIQLGSGDSASRSQAAERLALLGDPQAVPPLIEVMATAKDAQVKVSAALALGVLRDRRAVEALVTATHAPESAVRTAAISSLGRIADHTSSEALLAAAKDDDAAVRGAALESLAALGISVERLSADVNNANWQTRAAAIAMLGRLGDARSTPLLLSALKDQDSRVRAEAARTIALMAGPTGDSRLLDGLTGALRDPSTDVRIESTYALGRLRDARAIAPLTGLLSDRDARVSIAAAESLARMKDARALRVLGSSLADNDWRVRARAAQVLARVSADTPVDDATPQLARAVTDKDPVVRYYAAEALAGIGAKAVAPLVEILRTPRDQDRERAARVLWRIGKPAVEPLIAFIQDRGVTAEMRAVAAHALGVIGDANATAVLLQLLRDERYFVREQAAFALGQMGQGAVDQIVELSNAGTPATREAAIEALGRFNLPRTVQRLQEALEDRNASVRTAAVNALGQTGSERAVPPLMVLMRDESSPLRGQAAAALGKLGDAALPSLIGALKDSRPSVRQLASEALGDIGSKQAVPALLALIAGDQSGARAEAIEALGKIGDSAAIAPVLEAMRDGSIAVRKKGIVALARFRDPRTTQALERALADRNEEIRQIAAVGLGDIGGAEAVNALERIADSDSSSEVRDAAVRSIERIRAQGRAARERVPETKPTHP